MTLHYGLISRAQALDTAIAVNNAIAPSSGKNGVAIILETACAETLLGTLKDPTEYYAGSSICQIDESTFNWLRDKYSKTLTKNKISDAFGFDIQKIKYREIELNPLLGMIFCRLRYLATKPPIPETMEERAKMWKKYYNTSAGKGTVAGYIDKCNKCNVSELISQIK